MKVTSSLLISISVSLWAVATTVQGESASHESARVASIAIPHIQDGPKRAITTDDLIALRDIDSFSLSPDGSRFAVLLRQADPGANTYRTGWFIGSTTDAKLTDAGDGGEVRLTIISTGVRGGEIAGAISRWSADGRWIAYTLQREGEVQLWRSSVDGRIQEQLTRNGADVRDFVWSEDGQALFFTVGSSRASRCADDENARRNGIRLDEFQRFTGIVHQAGPERPVETELTTWAVGSDGRRERLADAAGKEEFEKGKRRNWSWGRGYIQAPSAGDISGSMAPPVVSKDGALAWLARANSSERGLFPMLRLTASLLPDGSTPIACAAAECTSQIFSKVWWSADGKRVIFWREEGINLSDQGFYAWSPSSGVLKRLWRSPGDRFKECELVGQRLICVRETRTKPAHVAEIDTRTGRISILADFNPEFRNIRLAEIERFEWNAPPDSTQLGYAKRAYGYILYPPDFDPKKKYPVLISPYGAQGFTRGDVGDEQPLFVYAANGFVVLNTAFLYPMGAMGSDSVTSLGEKMHSAELGFPHLTMLMESTLRALDVAEARGWVDPNRVGIGGLSQGTLAPFYMLQNHDRLSAVSVSGPGWSQWEYYSVTSHGRAIAAKQGADVPWPESAEYWAKIDLADHIDAIEAPILFQVADREAAGIMRLQRRLGDAQRPFEAFIFPDEYHEKWQPAHRYAIYNRNLDWFRFWLQDYEEPSEGKAAQYARWRALRELQCQNPRSLRTYCSDKKSDNKKE